MGYDDERDTNGNHRSSSYSSDEAMLSGGAPWDSKATLDWKVYERRRSESERLWGETTVSTPSTSSVGDGVDSGSVLKMLGVFFALVLVLSAIMKTEAWWRKLPSPIELVERYAAQQQAEARRARFSDFATPAQWPKRVQVFHRRSANDTLEALLLRVPKRFDTLPKNKREELAAQIWFKLAAQGSQAHDAYAGALREDERISYLSTSAMVLSFLDDGCRGGVEAACLDAARARSGFVFHSDPHDGRWLDERALQLLPTSGALAASPAIIALRERIARQD